METRIKHVAICTENYDLVARNHLGVKTCNQDIDVTKPFPTLAA
jgi:hypothetical protein